MTDDTIPRSDKGKGVISVLLYPNARIEDLIQSDEIISRGGEKLPIDAPQTMAFYLDMSNLFQKVYVVFKIDKTGHISEARARGPHARLEKEALRVVNMLPKLTPGKQRGIPVSVSYTLPITLQVQI